MKLMNGIIVIFIIFLSLIAAQTTLPGTVNLLTDIKIVYLYDRTDRIDWALIYYLAAENGCHVDLATVKAGPGYRRLFYESDLYDLTSSRFFIPDTSLTYMDTLADNLFGVYLPDIVIFSGSFDTPEMQSFERHLLGWGYDSTAVFSIKKYFRRTSTPAKGNVYFKARQYAESFYGRIEKMARAVSEQLPDSDMGEVYSVYESAASNIAPGADSPSFLCGIDRFRFDRITEKYIASSVKRAVFRQNRERYVSHLTRALESKGLTRVTSLLDAVEEMKKIRQTYYYQIGSIDSTTPVAKYIEKTLTSLSSAVFYEAGVDYKGRLSIRETAEGRKLKFRAEIDNNGFMNVKAGWLEFAPSWSDSAVIIDSTWAEVTPNNSLIREYTIEVPPKLLKEAAEESLVFRGRIVCAGNEVAFEYRADAFERSPFAVEFVPDFLIVKPFPELQIDHLVEQANLKAIITKPSEFSGPVRIEVSTPPGVFSGAYREEVELRAGESAVELRIPMVVTGSIGTDRHEVVINVIGDGRTLASDVARVRQVEYFIPSDKKIALVPGAGGVTEDILMQTGAGYGIVSDRFLKAGDYELYDMILFAPGAAAGRGSLDVIRDRLKGYMEFGGVVIILAQPDEWPESLFPVSIHAAGRKLAPGEPKVRDRNHPIFNGKAVVDITRLLKGLSDGHSAYPATVFPGEKILEADNNTALISETKFGEGHLIYCGLPLPEMIRGLDVEAIKLLSNLLTYSGM
ncbi:MAG: hypothetical protein JSU69_02120 [Candidatus Zixiibacteriota bacterium]|nr:MAG: hypothetical protein JSU69_02120 [candidate division Zixibacteria bacterium]